jgi:hypothetical protein
VSDQMNSVAPLSHTAISWADLIVSPWIVEVSGFREHTYFAKSRGSALSQAWRQYVCYRDDCTFGDFLKIAKCYAGLGTDRFGEHLTIAGLPAFYVSHDSQYIQFVRPGSDVVLNSHPLDVFPVEARRGTPYAAVIDGIAAAGMARDVA